jgi:hypothetical protein
MLKNNIPRFIEVSVMMAPKTSKSQIGILAVAGEIVTCRKQSLYFVVLPQ